MVLGWRARWRSAIVWGGLVWVVVRFAAQKRHPTRLRFCEGGLDELADSGLVF